MRRQSRVAEAEALCRRAVENEEKSLGANHPSVEPRFSRIGVLETWTR
jgi:hypothetical protein